MTMTRGRWTGFLLAGLCVAAAPFGRGAAHAQGFGPDPFKPYNSQYEQYTTPMSPPGVVPGRGTGRNDNEFTQYLRGLDGADRASTERYGIGAPYWWAKSFDYERKKREAQISRKAQAKRSFEDTLESINQKYLAFFSEPDPRKRALLIQEFTPAPRRKTREEAARSDEDIEVPGGAGLGSDRRTARAGAGGAGDSPSLRGSATRSDEGGRTGASLAGRRSSRAGDDTKSGSIPPPPAIRGSIGVSKKKRAPSETLKRSLDDDDDSDAASPSDTRRPTARRRTLPPDE